MPRTEDAAAETEQQQQCHAQHLAIAKEVGDRSGEGTAYRNLGCAKNRFPAANLLQLKSFPKLHETGS
jgi:hypothetical protein